MGEGTYCADSNIMYYGIPMINYVHNKRGVHVCNISAAAATRTCTAVGTSSRQ
jgi:hypothetical protein